MVTYPSLFGQNKGVQMDFKQLPTDPLSLIQWVVAALLAALFFIPKYLKEHKMDSGMIDRLVRELASEREKRVEAENRADTFADDRNRLILEFSDMKRDSALVLAKLNHLTEQNAHLTEQNGTLALKVEELTQALERLSK